MGVESATTTRRSVSKVLQTPPSVSSVVITETHPMQNFYTDATPPPKPIDQFAPYLSQKLTKKRQEKIEKIKGTPIKEKPSFALQSVRTSSQLTSPRSRKVVKEDTYSLFEIEKVDTGRNNEKYLHHLKMEETFDKIVSNSSTDALHKLVEVTLQYYYLADAVYFYHDIASVKTLYCPSKTNTVPHGAGTAGFTQFSREILNVATISLHESYSPQYEGNMIPPDSHLLSFPLFDVSNNVKAVVQVVRSKNSQIFNNVDEEFAKYFQDKCKKYSPWMFQPLVDDMMISELIQTTRLRQFIEKVSEKLTKIFNCHDAELWAYNTQSNIVSKFTTTADVPTDVPASEAGIAGFSLRKQVPVSVTSARVHSAFFQKSDINGDFSVLSIPIRDQDSPMIYSVVLRGKRLPRFFTEHDELNSAMSAERSHQQLEDSMKKQGDLKMLLEVAEILSGELKFEDLIPKIMSKACDLVKASRCSLFIANDARDKLITAFSGGVKGGIEVPFRSGVVGACATTAEVVNVKDAYEDPRFNRTQDLKTGFRTVTILCVPIFDKKGQVKGVTEMINKIDGFFTDEDSRLIEIFNVFTGISLDNAQLYRAALDLSLHLRTFMDISQTITQTSSAKKILEDILKSTRQVLSAVTGAIYIVEENGVAEKPTVIDEDYQSKVEYFARLKSESEHEVQVSVKRAIIMRLIRGKQPGQTDLSADEVLRNELVNKTINQRQSIIQNDNEKAEKSAMAVPIISTDKVILGAVVMQWKKNSPAFNYDDLRLLESYSLFLSICLERSAIKRLALVGGAEVEMISFIPNTEREMLGVPPKLSVDNTEREMIQSINFDANLFEGFGLFRVVFDICNEFEIFKEFKITSETLFRMLHSCRESYNNVPYHNFIHAVDVLQFATFIMRKMKNDLTKFEILALIVSCLFHDANHDGFTNAYNVEAQTPLGILFKNQSVLETHHCTVCIDVISRRDSNVFKNVDELSKMWQLVIDLILSTDMARHFDIMSILKDIVDNNKNWRNEGNLRLTVLQMIIKLSDISSVGRSFELADRWCGVLCEEFFRQGDLEKAAGMKYTSPINDRDHLDRANSQIGFYRNVCLPFFEISSKIIPDFSLPIDNLMHNLDEWKTRTTRPTLPLSLLIPPPPPPV